jgi:hypothetical protein
MLLTIDVLKIDFLVVDVIELDVLGARRLKIVVYFSTYAVSKLEFKYLKKN